MHALIDHLRDLAANPLGTGDESPLDPGIRRRATALLELVDLLEEDPTLVRSGVRRTIDAHVFEPLPGVPTPVLGARGAEVFARYGWGGPVGVPGHLRTMDLLAAAVVRDAWDLAEAAVVLLDTDTTTGDLGATLGLHGFEVDAAISGPAPDDAYFLRRPGLTEDERRAELEATARPASN